MRAVVITKHGPPEVLQVQERPDPVPGPGEIRIAVKAAGINFADLLARTGMYPDAPKTPSVVGYEVAGVVESLGEGVTEYQIGDRVVGGTKFGGYSELVVSTVARHVCVGRPAQLRAGGSHPGQLRHGVRRAGDHGWAAHGRPRPYSCRCWWCRNFRHSGRQERRRGGVRYGVAVQARRHPRLRC